MFDATSRYLAVALGVAMVLVAFAPTASAASHDDERDDCVEATLHPTADASAEPRYHLHVDRCDQPARSMQVSTCATTAEYVDPTEEPVRFVAHTAGPFVCSLAGTAHHHADGAEAERERCTVTVDGTAVLVTVDAERGTGCSPDLAMAADGPGLRSCGMTMQWDGADKVALRAVSAALCTVGLDDDTTSGVDPAIRSCGMTMQWDGVDGVALRAVSAALCTAGVSP